jgi:demethylmenaquinone methyltransferase/2-methoxy-6-polyprenyl-1,4-benzoquinol methylase
MTHLTGKERSRYVQSMFARIAGRYDLMNRLMTAGQDGRWRDEVLRLADLHPGDCLLDLGAGTGDLALAAAQRFRYILVVAADFTLEMMKVGQQRPSGNAIPWSAADATQLPFVSASFDAVISGFLMRNVADLPGALAEQYRVLKPGGRIVILDTTRPPRNLLTPFIRIHLHIIIPTLGKLIAGDSSAYTYLPDSTEGFLAAEALAERMRAAGFQSVRFERRMFGTIAVHFGVKER